MDGTTALSGIDALVDDRVDEGVFRVNRSIYTDPDIFEAEMALIYENGWVYVCHEAQIAKAGDYFASELGRQPIVVWRQKDGGFKCLINACSHRAALLTPYKQGNGNTLTCRFHGWTYNCDGRCIKIKNEESGFPQEDFDRGQFNLREVPRAESYQGFIFASLNPDVEPLTDYLAGTKAWIDLLAAQSTEGLEVVPGSSTYIIDGNWKLQAENAVDGYHVSTVHRVFASTIGHREQDGDFKGMKKTEAGRITGEVPTGCYDFGNGHMSIWATHTTPEVRPIYAQKERLERDLTPAQVDWILNRGRNLFIFPNVMLMDNPSTQIRVLKPIAVNRFEVTVYCIAPKGESKEARAARLRKFEDFYLTAGMATSDDVAALEDTHEGSLARLTPWNDFNRGIATMTKGPDEGAKALGFEPVTSAGNWDHETLFHGMYRHWLKMMTNGRKP